MRKFSGNKQLSALADNRIAIDKNVAHGADAITQSIIKKLLDVTLHFEDNSSKLAKTVLIKSTSNLFTTLLRIAKKQHTMLD